MSAVVVLGLCALSLTVIGLALNSLSDAKGSRSGIITDQIGGNPGDPLSMVIYGMRLFVLEEQIWGE